MTGGVPVAGLFPLTLTLSPRRGNLVGAPTMSPRLSSRHRHGCRTRAVSNRAGVGMMDSFNGMQPLWVEDAHTGRFPGVGLPPDAPAVQPRAEGCNPT